jgi:hypothetical protein
MNLRDCTPGKLWTTGRQWQPSLCANWELRALTGAAKGLSRTSLGARTRLRMMYELARLRLAGLDTSLRRPKAQRAS